MRTVYFIGNAHIDPVWLWRWQDGFAEIRATFRSVLDRMKEYPEIRFSCACAAYYEWIEQIDPAMFAEIQARVAEGRWELVGGWQLQPDCNFPCGEAFARHALIAQRYFADRFGRRAEIGYNVDSFGHNGNLPQILRQSGMRRYIFMRPGPHEKELPASLFNWQSADGSTVRTFRIPITYCHKKAELEANMPRILADMDAEQTDWMVFYGIGNHGGGPSVELIETIRALAAQYPDTRFRFSTIAEYFDDTDALPVPTVADDLQFHAKGCYSANATVKAQNRTAEHALLTAEKWNTVADGLCGAAYPSAALTGAWKDVLFNQFHDILGGCAIADAYRDADYLHGEAMAIAQRETNLAQQRITAQIDTVGDFDPAQAVHSGFYFFHEQLGTPIVVMNPLPWPVTAPVRLNVNAQVRDPDGSFYPSQSVRTQRTFGGSGQYETLCAVPVPAMGYRLVYAVPTAPAPAPAPVAECGAVLENAFVRLTFRADGTLTSYIDRTTGREMLAAPADAVLVDDHDSDTWAHGKAAFPNIAGAFTGRSMQLLERGAVRSVLRATAECDGAVLTQDYTLYTDQPAVQVHASVRIPDGFRILRLRFPAAVGDGAVSETEIPFGTVAHPRDGSEQPCGMWCALHDGETGLSFANATVTSYCVDGNVLALDPIRTTLFADHCGSSEFRDAFSEMQDTDTRRFTYTIAPYRDRMTALRQAYELNVAPTVVHESFHKGVLPTVFSGISVQGSVCVTTVKKAENGDRIVRAYEVTGRPTDAVFTLNAPTVHWHAKFAHDEVKTFRISGSTVTECNLLEEDR